MKIAMLDSVTMWQDPRSVAVVFLLWAGMVLAISFMEAWVKFRAKLVTRRIGLDVGRNVFKGLNRMELAAAAVSAALAFRSGLLVDPLALWLLWTPHAILMLQTAVLMPVLLDRIHRIVDKEEKLGSSFTHLAYVLLEIGKVATLLYSAIGLVFHG